MAAPVEQLFSNLEKLLSNEDHAEAIDVCDQILAAAPGDGDALHSKIVSLIELSKTEDALKVLEATPALAERCVFEKAYCLYSLYREDEALQLLMPKGAEPSEARELQLAGQIKYRKGDSAAAAALLQKAEAVAGPSAELSTNILAALVSAGKGAEALEYAKAATAGGSASGDDGTHFELFYNHACAAIATGQLSMAQKLLKQAIEVCRSSLSAEDYTEEEVEVELGVLTAQSAYVDQMRGDRAGAEAAYQTLFAFKADLDPAVTAVAANNMIAIHGSHDLFDSWKKCKANLADSLVKKLTPAQRLAFLCNGALLSLHMNKPDQCKQLLTTIESEFPASEFPPLLRAALLHRAKDPKRCEEALEAAAASAAEPTAALLTLAQLQLKANEPKRALATLGRVTALKDTAGMVGTLVSIHEKMGDADAAVACFEGATEPSLLRAAASFFSRHSKWRDAAAAHQRVLDANPRDLESLAGLIIATSHYDAALANEHYARLEVLCPPPEEEEVDMVDALELEQAALPKFAGSASGGGLGKRAPSANPAAADDDDRGADGGSGARARKKRKRRKPPRYPKGFDPENPSATPAPDPERWLPKRERSTYRQRKKDKRAGVSRGPQGSATGAARVDAKATTNIQVLSESERAKRKAEEESAARAAAAAEAAAAAGRNKKNKGKGKGKW